VLLAKELVQGAGAHPGRQWRFPLDLFPPGVVEKVHARIVLEKGENTSQQTWPSW
jgi:hypothetical protein